jgi:tetratricopeptide (TPR) repeat protein
MVRARRQLEGFAVDCVERGYLLIPVWLEQMGGRNFEDGYATAVEAGNRGSIRRRRSDLAGGRAGSRAAGPRRAKEGLRLVDEVLAAASANDLSPIVTGIVYCNTIAFCRAAHDVRHVREWTRALTAWCERQTEMIAHNGLCLVHRAEIMLLNGDWEAALNEARRSLERFTRGALNRLACGHAFYCVGEVHRLRGEFSAAEDAYRQASLHGREPQPGLALMRLAQGRADSAAAALRRCVAETTVPLRRAAILPTFVETMLAIGSPDLARAACRELDETTAHLDCEALDAMAAHSRGATLLAEGQPHEALIELRRALSIWTELDAPYEIARVRLTVGLACRALDDHDTARLELDAARNRFRELGAVTDEARPPRSNPAASRTTQPRRTD